MEEADCTAERILESFRAVFEEFAWLLVIRRFAGCKTLSSVTLQKSLRLKHEACFAEINLAVSVHCQRALIGRTSRCRKSKEEARMTGRTHYPNTLIVIGVIRANLEL
jgi:hypothetical protein